MSNAMTCNAWDETGMGTWSAGRIKGGMGGQDGIKSFAHMKSFRLRFYG